MGKAFSALVPITDEADRARRDEGESPLAWAAELNLLWLVDVARDVACEILDRRRDANRRLDAIFERVERVAAEDPFTLSLRDGEVDVLFLYDLLPSLAAGDSGRAGPGEVEVLAECRRVLRENGCVCLRLENGNWYRNLPGRIDPRRRDAAMGRIPTPARVGSWLRKAGFTDHRVFFSSPDEGFPAATIVPASAPAALAHLHSESSPSFLRRHVGRALARVGLGSLLYPRMIVVGLA